MMKIEPIILRQNEELNVEHIAAEVDRYLSHLNEVYELTDGNSTDATCMNLV